MFVFNTHTTFQTKALMKILKPDAEFTVSDCTGLNLIENFLDNSHILFDDSLSHNADFS
jgi:hypothetical protein